MRTLIRLIVFLVISTVLITASHANTCEGFFQLDPKAPAKHKFRPNGEFTLIKNALRDTRPAEVKSVTERFDRFLQRLFKLANETVQARETTTSALKPLLKENNILIQHLQEIFERSGEETRIIFKEIEVSDGKFKYMALDLGVLEQHKSEGLKKLFLTAQAFSVHDLHIDFFGSFVRGSAGSFQSYKDILTFSFNAVKMLFSVDIVEYVLKHELTHGRFDHLREMLKDSIFHTSYFSNKDSELYPTGIYKHYVSAEELYTYANNMFWATKSFLKLENHTPEEIAHFIQLMMILNNQLNDMSKQLFTLANYTVIALKQYKESDDPVYNNVWGAVDPMAERIAFKIPMGEEKSFQAMAFVKSEADRQKMLSLMKTQTELMQKYNFKTNNEIDLSKMSAKDLSSYRQLQISETKFRKRFAAQLFDQQVKIAQISHHYLGTYDNVKKQVLPLAESLNTFANSEHRSTEDFQTMKASFLDFRLFSKQLSMFARDFTNYSKQAIENYPLQAN